MRTRSMPSRSSSTSAAVQRSGAEGLDTEDEVRMVEVVEGGAVACWWWFLWWGWWWGWGLLLLLWWGSWTRGIRGGGGGGVKRERVAQEEGPRLGRGGSVVAAADLVVEGFGAVGR